MSALLQSKVAHGGAGFLLMGGWAAFANAANPWPAPLIAGVVQGSMTVVITLLLKRIVETIHARTTGRARWILPPILAFFTSVTLLSIIHTLAGTPEIGLTIAVPVAVSTGYALLYALTLEASHD